MLSCNLRQDPSEPRFHRATIPILNRLIHAMTTPDSRRMRCNEMSHIETPTEARTHQAHQMQIDGTFRCLQIIIANELCWWENNLHILSRQHSTIHPIRPPSPSIPAPPAALPLTLIGGGAMQCMWRPRPQHRQLGHVCRHPEVSYTYLQ